MEENSEIKLGPVGRSYREVDFNLALGLIIPKWKKFDNEVVISFFTGGDQTD